MSRYLGPKQKLSRREGVDLQLKDGTRRFEDKCKAKTKPGDHNKHITTKSTMFGVQFREKQKLKRVYGVTENQMNNYIKRAGKTPGDIGSSLLRMFEMRLDNVVFRLGFSSTRAHARQLISHRHVIVEGSVVNIPSYEVGIKEAIQVKSTPRDLREQVMNKWLKVNMISGKGYVKGYPDLEEVNPPINVRLVIEFYSHLL